jgi:hypothetical protein
MATSPCLVVLGGRCFADVEIKAVLQRRVASGRWGNASKPHGQAPQKCQQLRRVQDRTRRPGISSRSLEAP